jgi:fructose-1,6-bisphosphatase/inositol monophosphatase family enzyme
LSEAILSTGKSQDAGRIDRGLAALRHAGRARQPLRGYGDFLHYHLLARGALDVVLESDVNILDIAALSVIVDRGRRHIYCAGRWRDRSRHDHGAGGERDVARAGAGGYAGMKARRPAPDSSCIGVA